MRKFLFTLLSGSVVLASQMSASAAYEQTKIDEQLTKSANIIQELTGPNATVGIPHNVLEGAKCIAVVPGMKQADFVVGGHHGDGVATCKLASGKWRSALKPSTL
jgi:lipid-binding SYLF domain-containing protein